MKKVLAIVAAVALAFALALGDQLFKTVSKAGPLTWSSALSLLGLSKPAGPTTPLKPKLPAVTTVTVDEETLLSYDERMKKGDYYRDKGFLLFAVNEYAKASSLEPKNPTPYLRLTQANFDLGDTGKARADANQVLALDPSSTEAQFYLVLIDLKESQFDSALALLDSLSQKGITDPRLPYSRALVFIAQGKHSEAKALLSQARSDPAADASLKAKIDKLMAAYEEFEFAQGAEDLYLGELLARGLNEVGEYELAVHKLKEILKTRSDLRDAWNMLGFAYLNLANPLFAASAFEQSYKIDSQFPATQYFLGLTYSELARQDDAIVYLNYALNNGFEPKVVAQRKLADLYLDKAEYAKSVALYEQVLAANKQDINSFVRPIWIDLEFLNEPAKALKLGEEAVLAFPQSAMAYNLLGWSQMGTGNAVEAEKNLLKALGMDPTLAAARYNLGKLYESLEENDKAKDQYQQAYTLDQNGSIGNLAAKRYNILSVEP